MSGQLRPGDHVRQKHIANALGVSATPVREGLVSLRREGFVFLLPRRGFVVSELSSDDIRDLFTSQALIAGELAARATHFLTEQGLSELEMIQVENKAALSRKDVAEMQCLNHDFHRRINMAAGSDKLTYFLRTTAKYASRRFYSAIGGWSEASLHDHQAILRAKEPQAARLAVQSHLRHSGELLAENFASRDTGKNQSE